MHQRCGLCQSVQRFTVCAHRRCVLLACHWHVTRTQAPAVNGAITRSVSPLMPPARVAGRLRAVTVRRWHLRVRDAGSFVTSFVTGYWTRCPVPPPRYADPPHRRGPSLSTGAGGPRASNTHQAFHRTACMVQTRGSIHCIQTALPLFEEQYRFLGR